MFRAKSVLLLALIIGIAASAPARLPDLRKVARNTISEEIFTLTSRSLTQFWRHPVALQVRISHLPLVSTRPSAVLVHVPGFGGGVYDEEGEEAFPRYSETGSQIIHVTVNPDALHGHHSLVNSDNNGPWADAFVHEMLPALFTKLGLRPTDTPVYITGHSTGGWSAVYLLMSYPDAFAGAYATAPDPLDFRHFFTVDVTPGSLDNMYTQASGIPVWNSRDGFTTLESEIRENEAVDETQSEMRVDEWKWSHKLTSGLPARLFDRDSGELDQETLRSWQRFDMTRKLKSLSTEDKSRLQGKLHIICGSSDTYFLDKPTESFCEELTKQGVTHECLFVSGRDHIDLYEPASEYPYGLSQFIVDEIARGSHR